MFLNFGETKINILVENITKITNTLRHQEFQFQWNYKTC